MCDIVNKTMRFNYFKNNNNDCNEALRTMYVERATSILTEVRSC